ncbi:hypothetical protein AT959_05155 [Dechloromonas denitrificans]|uniref:Uncharacterized protein n=1 Tax=Dechloromonas denitrificans TaxID=281362 RepID=A0A133XLC2_9RHOO|nr:hypothetical protein [Dechloromonas denitrificans]KXB31743.1 hypothetical protein AT959_05155 [Dechloromonas denitrificans]
MSAIRLKLVECRAILGGERDPFRVVWDEQATTSDRRVLLAMAGEPAQSAGRLAGRAWCDLRADLRGRVLSALKRFSGWAEKLK